MGDESYLIGTMNREDINLAVEWAAEEGWNPGLHDADCFFSADQEGFLIGRLGDDPIASISAVKYGGTFGFIGFYIVRPEHRGQGYGIRIWNAALKALEGRNIGLDGVVQQQDNYKKSGFELAYRNIRHEGVSGGEAPNDVEIVKCSSIPFDLIEQYDRSFFPEARTRFLQSWIAQPESLALAAMENGNPAGYGMIRTCRSGYKIGPLFADNARLAEALFVSLKAGVKPGLPVFLDTPELNKDALALAERHHMKFVFETARMYTGTFPDLPLQRIFGVTTFELG